ncbi:MAG: LysR family transcriptional regulator [Acidimicrobiia bacterium]|nr:LysR family transcriptional regulator [Acidimicrobiia bacterium]
MDFRQLAALVAVSETGSFSGAARALHTVQSNISTHIAHLERELGAPLVDRRSGELTAEGKIALQRARHVQQELEALRDDVAAMGAEVVGSVRLGCIGTVARWLIPLVLESVSAAHPKVRVVVVDATTTSLVPQLIAGDIDLAVLSIPTLDNDLVDEALFEEDRIVIAPDQHPLAQLTRVSIADLAAYELLLGPPGTAFRDELDAEAASAGVVLRPQAEVDGLRLIATLAFQGYGAAIVPATAAPRWLEGKWKRVSVDGLPRRHVGLAQRRRGRPSAPVRALRESLIDVVQNQGPAMEGVHPLAPRVTP